MEMIKENITSSFVNLKYSGEDWVGDIPKHWEMKRLKHLFFEKKMTHDINLPSGSISFGKVVYKDDEKIPESTKRSYQVLNIGEFLINPLNLNYDLISLRIGLSEIDVVVSSGYIIILPKVNLNKAFYKWLLHRFDVAFMKTLGSGVRQTISFNHIANCLLPFPPLKEQTEIAAFLDKKTALIDQAIEIKQKQIELLKERKQIIIQKAVTRGLNPNVKMKDSGVEWIGEIPEHWEVNKFKKLLKKNGLIRGPFGSALQTSFFTERGYKVYEQKNAIYNDLTLGKSYIPESKFRELKRFEVLTNDFLMSCSGTIGKMTQVVGDFEKGIINQAMLIMRVDNELFNYEYFSELFESQYMQSQIIDNSMGSAMKNLVGMDTFKNLKIITPTIDEQSNLVQYIKKIKLTINNAIDLKEQEIERIKEYKATLINSAVTGKIKVC